MERLPLSIIIPTYNEEEYIRDCLESVKMISEECQLDVELIVIDNGSTDSTPSIANELCGNVHSIQRVSISEARNRGVSLSNNKIIAFIDSDIVLTKQWAKELRANHSDYIDNPMFITGCKCGIRENPSTVERHWFGNIEKLSINGANIVTSRLMFDKAGGFDPELKTGEDYDFCERVKAAGGKLEINKNYECIHLGYPTTISAFMKREIWHGIGDFQSIPAFLNSKVAVLSVLYVVILALSLLIPSYVPLVLLIILNAAITYKRFSRLSLNSFLVCNFLNFLYFIARACSLFRALKDRAKNY